MSDPIEDANDTVGREGQDNNDNTVATGQGEVDSTPTMEQNDNTTTAAVTTTTENDASHNATAEVMVPTGTSSLREERNPMNTLLTVCMQAKLITCYYLLTGENTRQCL